MKALLREGRQQLAVAQLSEQHTMLLLTLLPLRLPHQLQVRVLTWLQWTGVAGAYLLNRRRRGGTWREGLRLPGEVKRQQ